MKRVSLQAITEEPVSHNPEIAKRVLLAPGEIPRLTNLSQAVLKGGQKARRHAHEGMYEVFVVRRGTGVMEVDGSSFPLRADDCVVIEPGEQHEIGNPEGEDLVLLYFGVLSEGP